ncbi:MAG: hypothetical protein BGO98_40790 [Myxococcales bacterium 68-20]|nr:hypothetical protein [Myxococcales bacterium]OJY19806.1 MAG: hypothetical protein BGO98_40790 [Myxococcales bacterium 68-20]
MTIKIGPAAAFLLGVLGVAAGCALNETDDATEGEGESQIRELERRAVGPARAYPAERYTDADAEIYAKSKKARRELGWHVLAKALQPVKIAAQPETSARPAPTAPVAERTIPLFRTWFGGDEIDRMFAKMYGDLGKDRRLARDVPTEREVNALFEWNAKSLGPNSESEYFARLAQITNQQGVDGLGGNGRVAYSPGYVKQYLTDYPTIASCKLDELTVDSLPKSEETNFTNCFSREFDADAAVIKASWRRNDALVTGGLPAIDTSAPTLATRMTGELDSGGWNLRGVPLKKAGPEDAYSVTLSDETGYSLVGLHVMTKELRHWVWVTVWWSDKPDEDFGQDRPDEIKALGAPWSNYKMCVITDFEEKDQDPRGGFEGSLGDALAAVHGKATWCSNGFIEKGAHNAQTNCIGCHQHAGDVKALDRVLTDETAFPASGRLQNRKGFPADYSWAFATPASPDQKDRLYDVVVNRMKVYARDDIQ